MEEDYGHVEAVLFAAGKALSIDQIMELCSIPNKRKVRAILAKMKETYDKEGKALMLIEENDFWKISVREKYINTIRKIVPHTELSKTVMETLAVIAWKAPVMQSKIIDIRTNKAYDHIDQLEGAGFITKQKVGRSYLLKLSHKFFEYFDVNGEKDIQDMFNDFRKKELDEKGVQRIEVLEGFEIYDTPLKMELLPEDSIPLFERFGNLEVYSAEQKRLDQEERELEKEAASVEKKEEEPKLIDSKEIYGEERHRYSTEEETPEKTQEKEEEKNDDFNDRWSDFEKKVAQREVEEKEEARKLAAEAPTQSTSQDFSHPEQLGQNKDELAAGKDEAAEMLETKAPIEEEDDSEKKAEITNEEKVKKKKDDLAKHILKNFDFGF